METIENCPKCGKKMERGYLNPGSVALFWSKKKQKTTLGAEVIAGKRISLFRWHYFEAYRCPDCKIVIFHYGDEREEN